VADKTQQTIYIEAEPAEVMKAIADIESYPKWISEYKEVEVLEALDDGYPKKARMLMDRGHLQRHLDHELRMAGRPRVAELDPSNPARC